MALKTVTQHSAPLRLLHLRNDGIYGSKGSNALTVFFLGVYAACVGVRGGTDVSIGGAIAVGIERLASN